MADLKTNYKDDVLDTSKNEKRKFRMIQNDDGTVSFDDATEYTQQGDAFGAADINATNAKINEQSQSLTNENSETFNFGVKDGVRGYYTNPSRADDSFIPFNSLPNPLSLQVDGYIYQKINYPFGSGTMEANATCTFPLSAFWTLGYKKCSVNGKEYDTLTANVILDMGYCRKSDGLGGSTNGKKINKLVFSY